MSVAETMPRGLGLALVALAAGHALSNALRTMPAIAADLLAADLGIGVDRLATIVGMFHLSFAASQVPLGVALDRYGVRPVALFTLALATLGAVLAALATGPWSMLAAQLTLGVGCAGGLVMPLTLAGKQLSPARFGLWTGIILMIGNSGMLISSSPLAWLIEVAGWRAGFWSAVLWAALLFPVIALLVREPPVTPDPDRTPLGDARHVVRLLFSARLRDVVVIAFVSLAAMLTIRGLWGGPWLMEVQHLSRIQAGHVMLLLTLALVAGPALIGMVERRTGAPRAMLAIGHVGAGCALLAMVALAAHGPGSDMALLVVFGLLISTQPLAFLLTRLRVTREETGRALAAVNLSFFAGAATLQPLSGLAAAQGGPGAGIGLIGVVLIVTGFGFLWLSRRARGAA